MAEETQEISSAPQEPEMTADELWDTVDNEDSAESGSDEIVPESVDEDVAQEATGESSEAEEEPQHDWEKRYKDLEKDYHKRNEDNASFKRDTESKQGELERQLQALQIERLENRERLQKLSEIEQKEPETQNTLDALLSDTDKQTMKDFEEVMNVVNKIVDHKLKTDVPKAPIGDLQSQFEETQKAIADIQYQRLVDHYDSVMRSKVGEDYLEIDTVPEFVDYVNANPVLKDILKEKTPDPEKHSWVVNTWLNTDEGRAYRAKQSPPTAKTSSKQQQKRETAKSLAKNTAPPQEVDTSNMNEDELWEHIISQEED